MATIDFHRFPKWIHGFYWFLSSYFPKPILKLSHNATRLGSERWDWELHQHTDTFWLVVSTPLKNMSSSRGMLEFPIYGKLKIHVPNQQSAFSSLLNLGTLRSETGQNDSTVKAPFLTAMRRYGSLRSWIAPDSVQGKFQDAANIGFYHLSSGNLI